MFGFTVFWAYIAFAQYFLIWYGNMPEETQYYLLRRNGDVVSDVGHAAGAELRGAVLPLAAAGQQAKPATPCARRVWILVMHAYDLYWQVLPVLHPDTIHPDWMDFASPIMMGGVVLLSVVWGLKRLPLIPVRDARLNESDRLRERNAVKHNRRLAATRRLCAAERGACRALLSHQRRLHAPRSAPQSLRVAAKQGRD